MYDQGYKKLAYKRTAYSQIQRLLTELYVETDTAAKQDLVCEDVRYNDRVVSQEVLSEVLKEMEDLEQACTKEMARYELRRIDDQPKDSKREGRAAPPQKGRATAGGEVAGAAEEAPDTGTTDLRVPRRRKAGARSQVG